MDETTGIVMVGAAHSDDHSQKAVRVTKFTDITVDGKPGSIHDLKSGMMVDVDLRDAEEAGALDAKHVN